MKAITLILFWLLITVSCTETTIKSPEPPIQAQLNEFIRNQRTQLGAQASVMPSVFQFLKSKGFTEVDNNSDKYKRFQAAVMEQMKKSNIGGRTEDCNLGFTILDSGGGCWVAVWEFSSGCYHSGCVSNMWFCGDVYQGEAYLC